MATQSEQRNVSGEVRDRCNYQRNSQCASRLDLTECAYRPLQPGQKKTSPEGRTQGGDSRDYEEERPNNRYNGKGNSCPVVVELIRPQPLMRKSESVILDEGSGRIF